MSVDSRRAGPLLPGDPAWLGEYRLVGRLGSGGMGVVYLARDPRGGPVAIKLVHAHLAGDSEFRARFRSEVNRVRQVPSFCTAEVLDANLDHRPPYLVVEYVDGPSLAQVVDERGPLSPANLHSVAVGVATALAGIHAAGVIHRDLKPENVLLAPGSPKVIDFGIARAFEATSQHTSTDQFVGTVAYMAPERFSSAPGTALTAAADVFAWGCVMGFAGTGRTPFHGDSPPATAARILTQPPHLNGLSEPLRGLVELALAKEPEDRPTAHELLDMLVSGATGGPPPPPRPPRSAHVAASAAAPRHRTRRTRWVAALAALLVLAGLGTVAALVVMGDPAGNVPLSGAARSDGSAAGAPAQSGPPRSPAAKPTTSKPAVRRTVLPADQEPAPKAQKAEPKGGEPIIQDPLNRPGQWLDSSIREENADCVIRGTMLAKRVDRGVFQCAGPDEEIEDDFGVAVDTTLASAGSCAGVWFHWNGGELGGHVAYICQDEIRIGADMPDDRRVYGTLELDRPIKVKDRVRAHVVVRGRTVDVYLDGTHAGAVRLPARGFTKGQVQLGIAVETLDDPGPYTVAFADVDIRSF
jgi:hypothetical protein